MEEKIIQLFSCKEKCTGCSACLNICPTKSIVMLADEEGFLYPKINYETCVKCKRCMDVCALKKDNTFAINQHKFFCAKSKELFNRISSSSGGVFSEFAYKILKEKGMICGAMFTDDFFCIHSIIENKTDLQKLRGSKYVQSDLKDCYQRIKIALRNRKKVLFSGTPCQVDGLKNFLCGEDVENLLTVDLICHGVPSPEIWENYVMFIEKKFGGRLKEFSFRDKQQGWHGFNIKGEFENGKVILTEKTTSSYIDLYGRGVIIRPCCYNCKYASLQRPGDVTIGDFWGIDSAPVTDDNIGTSVVITNTKKGEAAFSDISAELDFYEISQEQAITKQPNLKAPTHFPRDRKKFWDMYHKNGFEHSIRRYTSYGIICSLKKTIRKILLFKWLKKKRQNEKSDVSFWNTSGSNQDVPARK